MAWPSGEESEKLKIRLIAEATTLYAKVFESEKPPAERCSLNSEWYNEAVPEYVARVHLGMELHADLVAAYHDTKPAEVLDPAAKMGVLFCSDDELRKHRERATSALQAKLIAENAQPDASTSLVHHTRIDYSFPVFNETFDRAIIVCRWTGSSWTWGSGYPVDGDNKRLFQSNSGSIHAYVWAKKDGVWQQINSEEMAQFD